MFAVAYEPSSEMFYWLDLTFELTSRGLDAPILVPRSNSLGDDRSVSSFVKYAESVSQPLNILLDLVSTDSEKQATAVSAAYFVGRLDGRALVLLRRLLGGMSDEVYRYAVFLLARALHHPDFFATPRTWVEESARKLLRDGLTWTPDEVVRLVGLIDEAGIQRGSFGQNIFHLLVDSADPGAIYEGLVLAGARGEVDASSHLLDIEIYLAGSDGRQRLDEPRSTLEFVNRHPRSSELDEYLGYASFIDFF